MQSSANDDALIRMPVRIEMLDGSRMDVSLISPRALMKLFDLINREEKFMDAELSSGERIAIAKVGIKSVKSRDIPKGKNLRELTEDKSGFDPYKILEVTAQSDANAVRQAYLVLVRQYHPDRFASVELPKEVSEYLTIMLKRINAAYDMLAHAA